MDDYDTKWQHMHNSKLEALKAFNEAKFGMFIHWGAYSVPAGIWDGEKIPGLGEWIFYHAQIPRATYKEMCRQFNPTQFDAEVWVSLAKAAGMRYIVAMPKHHDGFAMYDTKVTDYDILDATPFDRDPIMELYQACHKNGLGFGMYYSHATDWMDGGDAGVSAYLEKNPDDKSKWATWPANTWDPAPVSFETYIESKAKPQMREILTNYPDMQEIWYDVPRHMTKQMSFEFYKLAYDYQPKCLINSRVGNNFGDYWVPGDNKIPKQGEGDDLYWETPGTLNNTWGYKSYDVDWKSTEELLFWILEIAGKGGNYLLNVGPKADGTIPGKSVEQLKAIGDWMGVNGEAIYGTRPWKISHEGPTKIDMESTTKRQKEGFNAEFTADDYWFTQKDDCVYVSALVWPDTDQIEIHALGKDAGYVTSEVTNVYLLGSPKALSWEQTDNVLTVTLPQQREQTKGYAIKITF